MTDLHEAIQWTGENWPEIYDFSRGGEHNLARVYGPHPDDSIHVDTPKGMVYAAKGDLVIRCPDGMLKVVDLDRAITLAEKSDV